VIFRNVHISEEKLRALMTCTILLKSHFIPAFDDTNLTKRASFTTEFGWWSLFIRRVRLFPVLYLGTTKQLFHNIKKRFSFLFVLCVRCPPDRSPKETREASKEIRYPFATASKNSNKIQRRSCWEGLGTNK
jgi:hypothetical protein